METTISNCLSVFFGFVVFFSLYKFADIVDKFKRTYYSDDPNEYWEEGCVRHQTPYPKRCYPCPHCGCTCGRCKCNKPSDDINDTPIN